MTTKSKPQSHQVDEKVMSKLRRQLKKVRDLERQRARAQKQLEREAYGWSSLGW